MRQRTDLQALLVSILKSPNVYFQAPGNDKMTYPCVVYKRIKIDNNYANNTVYSKKKKYAITYITSDPDDITLDELLSLPTAEYATDFKVNNLYHTVFNIYF